MTRRFSTVSMVLAALVLAAPAMLSAAAATYNSERVQEQLESKIRHELVMLRYFNVFDNLAFQVNGDTVILTGQVTRPTLKSSAENVVKRIEGVTQVANHIRVLPLSRFDDQLRFGVLRAVYGQPALQRYGLNPMAPIRIVVENGNVTLEGVVANETDRNIAGLRANGVPGVFSVTNNLRVETRKL